jgi:MSHA biogenesis protein MshO
MCTLRKQESGFTLMEMIIVIVITGIIGGIVAVFLKAPVQGYVDSARRAELTDIADTAMRRMARDVRTAVPNSVRTGCGGTPCVEFLPTKGGGRYRAQLRPDGTGNVLNFGVPDGSFDIVGAPVDFAANDYIAVGSTQSSGNPPYDQTVTGVLRAYAGAVGAQPTANFTNTALPVWAELPSQRFYVVDGTQQAVTYACVVAGGGACAIVPPINGNGTCQLVRYWGYNFNVAQVNPPVGGTTAILANNVSACEIVYDLPSQRFGLLAVRLTLTSGGESVSLYNEIHVNNAP